MIRIKLLLSHRTGWLTIHLLIRSIILIMTEVLTVYAILLITLLVYNGSKFHTGILIKNMFEQ